MLKTLPFTKAMFNYILTFWIFVDLLSKNLASTLLTEKINLIFGDFVYFFYTTNPGIAFSIYIPPLILKILTIILIIFIFYYYKSEKDNIKESIPSPLHSEVLPFKKGRLLDVSFALILAWAIWNAVERILYSEVTDFIGVKYFAVFNLADSFITIWAILYIIYEFRGSRKNSPKIDHPLTPSLLRRGNKK